MRSINRRTRNEWEKVLRHNGLRTFHVPQPGAALHSGLSMRGASQSPSISSSQSSGFSASGSGIMSGSSSSQPGSLSSRQQYKKILCSPVYTDWVGATFAFYQKLAQNAFGGPHNPQNTKLNSFEQRNFLTLYIQINCHSTWWCYGRNLR